MSDLSSRILNALDEAVAQEVGARLRQAAQNVPPGSGAPALPAHFEESLQRLKTLHAQVKVVVHRTFTDAGRGTMPTNAILSLSAPQDSPALKMDAQASERTARPAVRERQAKHGSAGHSKKRAMKKKQKPKEIRVFRGRLAKT
jgi:hypothetical protein